MEKPKVSVHLEQRPEHMGDSAKSLPHNISYETVCPHPCFGFRTVAFGYHAFFKEGEESQMLDVL